MDKKIKIESPTIYALIVAFSFIFSNSAFAQLSADVESKVKTYQEKLASWAKDPEVINAIKSMNGEMTSMTNASWRLLTKDDPKVQKYISSTAGKKLQGWQQDKSLGKLFLRDKNGNFVAGSKKPAIYNIADRAPFKQAITGMQWNSKKAKTDPTTKKSSIQLSSPVISDGEKIGIIHTAIILE